jgi:formyltetrahydrofolate-dependent phosphoribosylglycinamide formyltransferase
MGEPLPLRLGVLFSGGGRTLENLARRCLDGTLPAKVAVAISSHPEAAGIERARRLGVTCRLIDYRGAGENFSDAITRELEAAGVDLVLLAGFIRHYRVPPRFAGRVMNIHPALLPGFGGKGFYGDRVHRAVIAAGVKFSGCTVHFVTDEYDGGPIILQRVVPVAPDDTPATLAERVFAEECIAYPEAVRLYSEGRLMVEAGRVRIVGA